MHNPMNDVSFSCVSCFKGSRNTQILCSFDSHYRFWPVIHISFSQLPIHRISHLATARHQYVKFAHPIRIRLRSNSQCYSKDPLIEHMYLTC